MFIFITVCNKGFHKAGGISMPPTGARARKKPSKCKRGGSFLLHPASQDHSGNKPCHTWLAPRARSPRARRTPRPPGVLPPVGAQVGKRCSFLLLPLCSHCLHINLRHLLSCMFSSAEADGCAALRRAPAARTQEAGAVSIVLPIMTGGHRLNG